MNAKLFEPNVEELLGVTCPYCGALSPYPCDTPATGKLKKSVHSMRRSAAIASHGWVERRFKRDEALFMEYSAARVLSRWVERRFKRDEARRAEGGGQ
jgi:hypothetical protein